MSEPSVMKKIKVIHNHLNLSLKKGKVLKQTDQVLLGNAKQMLLSLKQQQTVLCDSLRENCKRHTTSNISRQALKKRINLLQKRQHKLLLLFQEHNTITKAIKTLNSDHSKQTLYTLPSLHSSQITDLSLLQAKKNKISNKIETAFDDTQSESASTVYSLSSLVWSKKIKPKSQNLLVCELNTLSQTPLLNNESSLCIGWLNENSTNMSNDFFQKPLPSSNISDFSLKPPAIPSTNMLNNFSPKPSSIPLTNISNDSSFTSSAIPSTNMSNNLSLKPSAVHSSNVPNDFSLKPSAIPSINMSNDLSLTPSAIPSTNLLNNFSPKPPTIPSTDMSNDSSLTQSPIPSTNMSSDFSLKTSGIQSTNISNDFSLKPSAIPSTNISNDFSLKPSAIPSNNISNDSSLTPPAIPPTNISNDFSLKPSAIPSTNISNDFSLKPSAVPSDNMPNDFSLKPSAIPSTNISNDFSLTPSAIPSTNMSNDSSHKPLAKKLTNCQKFSAQSQKKKSKSPNLLFCEPKLKTWKGVKADHNYSAFSQSQEPTFESSKIPNEKSNHSIYNFPDDSHVAINSEPNQTYLHNVPSQTPLPNNESSFCPNGNSTNMSNDSSLKTLPKPLTYCQQFTAIPIGTTADFSHSRFVKTNSHTQQGFDNQLVPNSFPSVLTSAHQNSGMASQESQNIPVHSRNDLMCNSTNISTMTSNRAGSLKLCKMKESHKKMSDLKSKHYSSDENKSDVWSKKDQTNLDDNSSQINTSLTHLTLIEDQELMPLSSILPSCQNTDSFGSINFPKLLWDGFHIWP